MAPIPLENITGIRLDALADDRLANRGPGRGAGGNFVVTEFVARSLPKVGPTKLVRSWDFAPGENGWQTEQGAHVVADSGMRYVFGDGQRGGIKTELKAPAGAYLVDIVTGIRPTVSFKLQWTTTKQPKFSSPQTAYRTLPASGGGDLTAPIAIGADGELTGIRIVVEDAQSVLPIDAIRLFSAEGNAATDIKLQNAKATFSQAGYKVEDAIDGKITPQTDNGWAIAPQLGRDHSARFELKTPLDSVKDRLLEFTIHQNFQDGQHSLGRFRISVTDSKPPLNFGLPPAISTILAKPADKRTDAERQALVAQLRTSDKHYKELQAAVATAKQPLPTDPRVKELETQLTAARQPLPIDPKLQQMRRAVELSDEQLKNKRLTVAQDIVWALINSPAFLYNH